MTTTASCFGGLPPQIIHSLPRCGYSMGSALCLADPADGRPYWRTKVRCDHYARSSRWRARHRDQVLVIAPGDAERLVALRTAHDCLGAVILPPPGGLPDRCGVEVDAHEVDRADGGDGRRCLELVLRPVRLFRASRDAMDGRIAGEWGVSREGLSREARRQYCADARAHQAARIREMRAADRRRIAGERRRRRQCEAAARRAWRSVASRIREAAREASRIAPMLADSLAPSPDRPATLAELAAPLVAGKRPAIHGIALGCSVAHVRAMVVGLAARGIGPLDAIDARALRRVVRQERDALLAAHRADADGPRRWEQWHCARPHSLAYTQREPVYAPCVAGLMAEPDAGPAWRHAPLLTAVWRHWPGWVDALATAQRLDDGRRPRVETLAQAPA